MKISHETPISLLPYSLVFNDYAYCLAHLYKQNTQYREWYKNTNQSILLDNGAHELGQSIYPSDLFDIITELKPESYILPDKVHDARTTRRLGLEFLSKYHTPHSTAIAVIQGQTEHELYQEYKFWSSIVDKVAISFDYPFAVVDPSPINRAMVRVNYIQRWYKEGKLNKTPIHLLGAWVPQEFQFYTHIKQIVSCDTSHPVSAGFERTRYDQTHGMLSKPILSIKDWLEWVPTDDEKNDIIHNIEVFRRFAS